ncbi:MAG: 1-hydroxycarotenoid 3,4-desaturase CrtD [Chitinophagaceae bacterium]
MHDQSEPLKAIVIGAGVAGLASAIRLAIMGFQVTVFEKNSYPGGKLSHFEKNGFHFDAGPSLFTQPQLIEELFALANEPIDAYFQYSKMNSSCKYFYEDGIVINAYSDVHAFAQELQEKVGEDAKKVTAYLQASEKVFTHIGNIFLNHSLHLLKTLFKVNVKQAIAATKPALLFQSLHQLNQSSFNKSHTVQLFNRYATYNGSNPYKAPGMLSLIPHLEHNIGTYYPKGGMIAITNALYLLAIKKGVTFQFNTPVESIIQNKHQAKGVVVQNKNHFADVIVSNMDVYFTYKQLLRQPLEATKILKQERSSSAFIFYWGMNTTFPNLQLHNIFFTKNYEAEFQALFNSKTLYNDPTVYVNITSKCEPGLQAPNGKENWFVMVNAPANCGQNWQQYQQQYRSAIIQKLSKLLATDIEACIEVEEILTPVTIESKTASYMGSLYGTSSNSKMAAFLRHPNFSKKILHLFFVGGSVHPGGGIPLCLQSAKIMSEIVAHQLQKKTHKH